VIPLLPNKPHFTPRDLAYLLHVSTKTVYDWIAAGILVANGRPVEIKRDEVERFLELVQNESSGLFDLRLTF
jgi:excisionase family DNA binding protein